MLEASQSYLVVGNHDEVFLKPCLEIDLMILKLREARKVGKKHRSKDIQQEQRQARTVSHHLSSLRVMVGLTDY